MRSLCGVAALVAVFGLGAVLAPGGRSWAEEKKEAKEKDAAKAAQAVKDIGTANDLIDYGRRNNDPKALLLGIDILFNTEEPSGEEIKVEGAGKETPPEKKAEVKKEALQKLFKEAKAMPTAANDTVKKLIAETDDMVSGKSRGTPNGGTSWQGIILPTDKKADKPVADLTRKFIGGQVASVCVAKLFNVGVPLDVRVIDPEGNEIQHKVGHSMQFDWKPRKDGVVHIQIRNYHTDGVLVKVVTN